MAGASCAWLTGRTPVPLLNQYSNCERLAARIAETGRRIFLHRIANAARYGELARHHFPKARQIYSVADLHHLRLARQAVAEDRPELSPMVNRLRLMEFAAAALADAVITHSSDEAKLLAAQIGAAKVHTVRWSAATRPAAVPLGVDMVRKHREESTDLRGC